MTPKHPVERACDRAQAILAKYHMDKSAAYLPPPKPDLEALIERLQQIK